MKIILNLLTLLLFTIGTASAQSAKGILSYYTKDSVLVVNLTSGKAPTKGTAVHVVKLFTLGKMQGTHGLATAKVLSVDGSKLKLQVTRYESTMVENGVRRPMVKKGNELRIDWGDGGNDKGSSTTSTTTTSKNSKFDKLDELYKERKYFEAAEEATRMIAEDAKCVDCYYIRGRVYQQSSRYEDAVADYSKAIEISTKGAVNAYFYRAECYSWMYQPLKALADYNHLLTTDLSKRDNIYLQKEKLKIYDKMLAARGYSAKEKTSIKKKACSCLTALKKIDEPKEVYTRDWQNKYCSDALVATTETKYVNATLMSQSEDLYTLKTTLLKTQGSCEPFGRKNYSMELKVGDYLNLKTCKDGRARSFTVAVVKVKAVEGSAVTLEVMYWSKVYRGKASAEEYKLGDAFSLEW